MIFSINNRAYHEKLNDQKVYSYGPKAPRSFPFLSFRPLFLVELQWFVCFKMAIADVVNIADLVGSRTLNCPNGRFTGNII